MCTAWAPIYTEKIKQRFLSADSCSGSNITSII